jgi:hypothetical protein
MIHGCPLARPRVESRCKVQVLHLAIVAPSPARAWSHVSGGNFFRHFPRCPLARPRVESPFWEYHFATPKTPRPPARGVTGRETGSGIDRQHITPSARPNRRAFFVGWFPLGSLPS